MVNAWFYPRGDWYTFYWDGSTADKVARRATYPTLEHDNYDPASSQSASGATSARGAAVRPLLRRLYQLIATKQRNKLAAANKALC